MESVRCVETALAGTCAGWGRGQRFRPQVWSAMNGCSEAACTLLEAGVGILSLSLA